MHWLQREIISEINAPRTKAALLLYNMHTMLTYDFANNKPV